eukprot:Lankesteria_metandrocarpae@DN2339_c0_g1_i3.p1
MTELVCGKAQTNKNQTQKLIDHRMLRHIPSIGHIMRTLVLVGALLLYALQVYTLKDDSVTTMERSFIMVKPDGVQRGLIGEVLQRFEKRGYKLVAAKVVIPTEKLAEEHYAEHNGKPFFPKLITGITSGPVFCMVWEGNDVIKQGRAMLGATNPLSSAPGTIRGDFAIDMGRNVCHGSDGKESADREIALWFTKNELSSYDLASAKFVYE